jgi:tetratricopeptide (TPR) repeat protein
LRAALGDYPRAIEYLQKAQESVPLPEYAAALEALYRWHGDVQKANSELALIDAVDRLMQVNGETMNRNLAIIFADENRKLDRALELAQAEFTVRNDVFTYDALSWVQFKRKQYTAAAEASEQAMKQGTADPMLYYHAGLIELALDRRDTARQYLSKAVSLSPNFDFRYGPDAKRLVASLGR